MTELPDDEFRLLIKIAPLASIDLIVRNTKKQILLKFRKTEPAGKKYFVPGGRIFKDETRETALKRIALRELGFEVNLGETHLLGVYEHFYPTNRYLEPGFGTHYVVSALEVNLKSDVAITDDQDHTEILWISETDLKEREDVDQYVKNYFKSFSVESRTPNELEHFVGVGISYEALMHHYVHYDEQMWDRTQLVIYVQGAAVAASWLKHVINEPLAAVILIIASLLTLLIWRLSWLDYRNSKVNQDAMDAIAKVIQDNVPTQLPRLRSEKVGIRGRLLLDFVFLGLLFANAALIYLNLAKKAPVIFD